MGKNKIIQNWQIKKLGEVCSIQTGKYDANHANSNGKYRFYTCAFDYLYCDTNRFKGQSIILPGNGANVGEVFYYNGDFDAYQRTYVLNEIKTDAKYLFYHLLGNWKNRNKDKQFGSATNYIRMANFTDYEIPIPPLETQQAIVSKIEELFSELDKGIAELKTAQQQLKTYRQSVLKSAFEGKLTNENVKDGELPEGWEIYKIKDVCDNVKVGIVIKPTTFYSKDNSGIKAFRSANVREFQVNDSNWVYFTEESNEINFRTKLKEGDVLLVRSGYPGTSCVVPKKYDGSNAIDILIATPNKGKILSDYLCCFNNSPLGKGMFTANSRGVAQKHLNVGEYSKLKINVPSLKEQHSIVQEIESRLSVADKMEQSIQESLQKAEALRQSILKKAFCGELV